MFRVQSLGCRGLGFRGLEFRVLGQGLTFRAWGLVVRGLGCSFSLSLNSKP